MAAPTFSYAQAAKGLKSNATSNQSSRAPSGAITPAKDSLASPALGSGLNGSLNWADDVETKPKDSSSPALPQEPHRIAVAKQTLSQQAKPHVNGNGTPPSPDMVASSTSTLVRDDDAVSIPNASSESTWEDKSQTSHVAEKLTDDVDSSAKGDHKKPLDKESSWVKAAKPQEAPIPTVNIWKQRIEAANAKTGPKPAPNSSTQTPPSLPSGNGKSNSIVKSTEVVENGLTNGAEKKPDPGAGPRVNDRPKTQRREQRLDEDANKATRSNAKNSPPHHLPVQSAPPPLRNEELWPTPEIALGGDRKKPEKTEKEKEKEKSAAAANKGKGGWKVMDIVPTVVFNTPLPTPHGRRGGRGGGRGGRDAGGRGPPSGSTTEKGLNGVSVNGDTIRRERPDGAVRSASPKGKRTASDEKRDSRVASQGKEGAPKDASASESRPTSKAFQEERNSPGAQSQTFPRQPPSQLKPNRRPDASQSEIEKRKDSKLLNDLTNGESTVGDASRDSAQTRPAPDNADEERKTSNGSEAVPAKFPGNDRKTGPQSFNQHRRSSVRGGRNGPHGFQGQNHQGPNGQVSYQNASFGLSRSPTLPQDAYYGQAMNGHRGFRPPPRTQSMGLDNSFGRYPNGFPSAGNLPPLNTFISQNAAMHEFPVSAHAMSAMPYTPFIDQYALIGMVSMQLEYYFSLDNLVKDMYLRKHMDSQGFVTLAIIADFNRIKALTQDIDLLKFICQQSHNIEWRLGADGKDRLRKREGWEKWVLELSQRDPGAQNDGPGEHQYQNLPQPQLFEQQPVSMPNRHASLPPMSPQSASASLNGLAINGLPSAPQDAFRTEPLDHSRFQSPPPSMNKSLHSRHTSDALAISNGRPISNGAPEAEQDTFSDAEVEKLSVMVRLAGSAMPATNGGPHRTLSNGSIESRSMEGIGGLNGIAAGSGPNGAASSHESDARMSPAPRDSTSPLSPELRPLDRRTLSGSDFSEDCVPTAPTDTFWVKDKDSPAHEWPENASSELYVNMRDKALGQLRHATPGTYPHEMIVLYHFWSHFLVRNFNTRMYEEFHRLADEDWVERENNTGMQSLIKYYSAALLNSTPIRDIVLHHLLWMVNTEGLDNDRPAFKSLRSAWRNGAMNLKTRRKIQDLVDVELMYGLDA